MRREYLDLLKCPKCGSEFLEIDNFDKSLDPRVKEGYITCCKCKNIYPIKNYIPRFSLSTSYADTFGPQWRAFAKSQIDTNKIRESSIRFDSEIGWQEDEIVEKLVVEFGSGAGRFVDIISRRKAKLVVGLDATDAVDAAQDNLSDRNNILFVQGDIFSCPIREAKFDLAYSIGVLHHTPNPEKGFSILTTTIKPPGKVGISCYDTSCYYRPNRNTLKVVSLELLWALNAFRCEFFRIFINKFIPQKIFLAYCKCIIPALHFINKIPLIRFFRYLLPSTCYKNLPVVCSMVDTYDTYVTKIVHQYRGKDIFQWFLHEGFINVILRNSRAGWVSITGVFEKDDIRNKKKMFLRQPGPPGL